MKASTASWADHTDGIEEEREGQHCGVYDYERHSQRRNEGMENEQLNRASLRLHAPTPLDISVA